MRTLWWLYICLYMFACVCMEGLGSIACLRVCVWRGWVALRVRVVNSAASWQSRNFVESNFSKVCFIVILYSKLSSELTLENSAAPTGKPVLPQERCGAQEGKGGGGGLTWNVTRPLDLKSLRGEVQMAAKLKDIEDLGSGSAVCMCVCACVVCVCVREKERDKGRWG